jgi:hypothetical protein
MKKLRKGDRVTVTVNFRPDFNGTITGEGRNGRWWYVLKDGNRLATAYSKDFCKPEVVGGVPDDR